MLLRSHTASSRVTAIFEMARAIVLPTEIGRKRCAGAGSDAARYRTRYGPAAGRHRGV